MTSSSTAATHATTSPSDSVSTGAWGNRLAEMQLRILWEELLPRFEKIEVVGEPEYVQSNFVRGISKLMVELTPKTVG